MRKQSACICIVLLLIAATPTTKPSTKPTTRMVQGAPQLNIAPDAPQDVADLFKNMEQYRIDELKRLQIRSDRDKRARFIPPDQKLADDKELVAARRDKYFVTAPVLGMIPPKIGDFFKITQPAQILQITDDKNLIVAYYDERTEEVNTHERIPAAEIRTFKTYAEATRTIEPTIGPLTVPNQGIWLTGIDTTSLRNNEPFASQDIFRIVEKSSTTIRPVRSQMFSWQNR